MNWAVNHHVRARYIVPATKPMNTINLHCIASIDTMIAVDWHCITMRARYSVPYRETDESHCTDAMYRVRTMKSDEHRR